MCIICRGDSLEGLQVLNCSNCPRLTAIPSTLTNLQTLYCYNCPFLTAIPSTLTSLQIFDCHNCPLLTTIPSILTSLQTLNGCPFLNHPSNTVFQSNLKKIVCIQTFLRTNIPI